MSKKTVPHIKNQDDLFQRDVRQIFIGNDKHPLKDARLVKNVEIATTSTRVAHGLGRMPTGFWVVDRTADSRVYRDSTVTTELTSFLHLRASTAGTFTLLVF